MGYPILLAKVTHRIYLVLHQGNQRRYNNSRSLHQKRRQLITERLTTTRRHQYKCILTSQYTFDNGLLLSFKCAKTKVPFQLFR